MQARGIAPRMARAAALEPSLARANRIHSCAVPRHWSMNAPHLQLVVMHSGHCKQHAEAEGGTFELTLAQHARPHVDQHHRHEGAYGSVENMPRAALRSAAAMRTAAEHGKHRPTGCHSSATKALSGDPSIAPQAAPSDALPETIAGKAGAARARATQCLRAAKSENVPPMKP